jgi:NADPH-dependent 2,4-dienoyl-CoA reductase/sulfur reductase-like enzyme
VPFRARAAAPGARAKVVIVGGGYGGATAARYLHKWGEGAIEVTLVEREASFVSCPVSNLVIGGLRTMAYITLSYSGLDGSGIRRIRDEAVAVDPDKRTVALRGGGKLSYDRLILSPGVDVMYGDLAGLATPEAQAKVLHAWKAGPQTAALRRQIEAMPDGGVFALHIPRTPFRCPPGPYERACLVASYFKREKPRSKVIVLDSNEEVQSKKALFTRAFEDKYKGMLEYRPNSVLTGVDVATLTAQLEFENVKADVLNVIPPQRAGAIAVEHQMANANGRFCQVDFLTFESTAVKSIHILGDAIQTAPLMPKSGHMANQHAKVCAAAVIALLADQPVNPRPVYANTCYSYVDEREVGHIASVHRYDAEQKTMVTVPGSGGLSPAANEGERRYAEAWARSIWADMLG